MRKILLLFCVLCFTQNIQLKAQAPPLCLTATKLFNSSPGTPIDTDDFFEANPGELWFKLPIMSDSLSLELSTFLTNYGSKVNKIELYKGLSCSGLTFLSKDSVSSGIDSILKISLNNLAYGDTLFLKTTSVVQCPGCTNDNQRFRLKIEFYNVLAPCPTCTTMTGCNLVCNGNFEQYNSPIGSGAQNITDACGWSNLNATTCDYYSATLPSGFLNSVPCNFAGTENPHGVGNGYAGFASIPSATSSFYPNGYNEYIKTKLLYPLLAGSTYTVSFWISQGEASKLTGNNVGVYFFSSPLPSSVTNTVTPIPYTASCTYNTTGLSENGWTPVTMTYTPTVAGLQYMAIGSFSTSYASNSCSVTGSSCYDSCRWISYVYIDDISVVGRTNTTLNSTGCAGFPNVITSNLNGPWQWGNGATGTSQSYTTTYQTGSGYTVTGTTSAGCLAMETWFINGVTPNENIAVTPHDVNWHLTACAGQPIVFTASGLSAPAPTYSWYNANVNPITLPPPTGIYPLQGTGSTYTYTPTSAPTQYVSVFGYAPNGCGVVKTVIIDIISPPVATINTTNLSMCSTANFIGTYTAAPQSPGVTYTWSVTNNETNVPFTLAPNGQSITVNWSSYLGSTTNPEVCLTVSAAGCASGYACVQVIPCCVPSVQYTIVAGSSDPANPTILNNATLPALGGSNINASLAMHGYFMIDALSTINWSNIRFAMAPGTKITVPDDAILKLTDCHFFACTQMWDGIYVQAGGSLQFRKYNLFEDALNAVVIETNATSTPLSIGKVYFNKCHIGIDFRASSAINNSAIYGCVFTSRNFGINTAGTTMPVTYIGNTGIPQFYASSNYTYYPAANVLAPYLPSRAHIGVNIADNAQASVGLASATAGNMNVFDNLTYGIHALSSNVYALHNKFIYIQKYCTCGLCIEPFTVSTCPPGTAICTGTSGLIASAASPKFTKVGVAPTGTTTYPNYFEQSQYGIYNINNRNLDARDNQFTIMNNTGIYNAFSSNYFSTVLGTFPANTINIQGNKMDRAQNGVFLNDNRNAIIGINSNDFNWLNWNTTTTQQSLTGITVNNAVAHTYGSLTISRNNIANLQKGITLTMQGYNGTGTTNRVWVFQNQIRFNQLQTSTVAVQHYGVGVFASKRVTVDGDLGLGEIIRVTAAPATYNTAAQRELFSGVRIENSPESWVTDMNITKTPGGIYVKGTCASSNFWCNTLTSAYNGVYLNNATLGDQLNLATPYYHAATGNQWISSVDMKVFGVATPSIFWYYGTGVNFNPNPSIGVSGVTFIVSDNPADACAYQTPPEEPGDPDARIGSSDTGNGETPKKDNRISSDNARMLDSLSPLEFYPVYLDSMGIEAAAIFNASIVTTTDAEAARKQVDEIHLRSWAQGIPFFNSSDSTYLCWLATEDPAIYGSAVYSAQVMVGECITTEETARIFNKPVETPNAVVASKGKIYPNPNDGLMQAEFILKENEKGTLEILSLSGNKLSSYNLKAGSNTFMIDESKLEAGIYLYRITINGAVTEIKKLVIVK